MDKKRLLKECYTNEHDYWNLPHHGLVPDWYLRYWDLHNLVLEYCGEEPLLEPLERVRKKG